MKNTAPVIPRFIVLEGIDGSGTSTQLAYLGSVLSAKRVPHWITCEPTERPEGLLVRRILKGEISAHPETLARLFSTDRCEHVYGENGIIERTDRGEIVICDRYSASSLAYQGVTCAHGVAEKLNEDFPLPALLLFFGIDPRISIKRLASRSQLDIYEEHSFQEKVAASYGRALEWMQSRGTRIVVIDASQPVLTVQRAVLDAVAEVLGSGLLR